MTNPHPSRRTILQALVAGAGVAALGGCTRVVERMSPPLSEAWPRVPEAAPPAAYRLASRLGYGPVAGQVEEIERIGQESYVLRQLDADFEEPTALQMRLRRLDIETFGAYDLRDLPEAEILRQLQQAALLRALYSPNQLKQRMVEAWSDHFNVFARKGLAAYRKAESERTVIRPNALGSFPAMLKQMARSTSMLLYLDNQQNRAGTPNENFARELLELHTMGVDGGYTYDDIRDVARCFTGWSEERRFLRPKGSFRFIAELHDDGEKMVLGRRIPAGGGVRDGEQVLDLLAKHPSTARNISRRLCRLFLGEAPDAWVESMSKTYLSTQGQIREMIRPLLLSSALLDSAPILKRPMDFLVSSLRATGAESDASRPLQAHLEAMGQPLYQWPMPDGYPTDTSAWSGSLLARWNFAMEFAQGGIQGTQAASPLSDPRAWRTAHLIPDHPAFAEAASETEALALALMSPSFQWR